MHRLFSTFARGWPGIGLLLMRLVAGVALLAHPHELEVLRTVEIAEEHFWLHRMQEPAKIRTGITSGRGLRSICSPETR